VTVRITKIDIVPAIDLARYVAVSGSFVTNDSFGKKVTLAFAREHEADSDDFTITDVDGQGRGHVPTAEAERAWSATWERYIAREDAR
jgi:hypothetical protein